MDDPDETAAAEPIWSQGEGRRRWFRSRECAELRSARRRWHFTHADEGSGLNPPASVRVRLRRWKGWSGNGRSLYLLPAEFSDHPAIKLSREAPAEHDYVSPAAACSTAALLAPVRSRAGLRPAHWPPVVVALGRSTAALLAPVRSRAGLRPAHWPPVVVALGRSTAALLAPVRSRAGLRPAHWPPAGLRWGCLGLVAPPCRWCWVSCPGDGLQSGRASRAVLGARPARRRSSLAAWWCPQAG